MKSTPVTEAQKEELIKLYPEIAPRIMGSDMDLIIHNTLMDLAAQENLKPWQSKKLREIVEGL